VKEVKEEIEKMVNVDSDKKEEDVEPEELKKTISKLGLPSLN